MKRIPPLNKFLLIAAIISLISLINYSGYLSNRTFMKNNKGPSDTSIRNEEPLIIAINLEPDEGFDPLLGWGRYGTSFFQSTLIKRDLQQTMKGDLANNWHLSPDGLVWKIRLREDALFSDGTPVTAKDVAFTFNTAAKSNGKTDVNGMLKAIPITRFTVEIHLKEPQITFINRLATLGIVPSHIYSPGYGRHPIGSGPYRLIKWEERQKMVMESNPLYYGKKPEIKKVIFMFMDEDAAFVSAKAGAVHVIRVPQMLANQKISGMGLYSVPSVDNRGICFPYEPNKGKTTPGGHPVGNSVTADLSIRQAINVAIDRKMLVEGILEGYGSPAHGPVCHLPWDEPSAAILDGDTLKARSILKNGGWHDTDKNGILEKNGQVASFVLLYPANDSVRQALALAVSDTVKKIGIEMIVKGKSWDDIYRLMHANSVLFGFGSLDQTEMHNLYFGENIESTLHNAGFYNNKTVNSYLKKAMSAPSEKEAISYWKKAQWDGKSGYSAKGDAAWAWLVNLDHTYFVHNSLCVGELKIEQHGSSIISNLPDWRWVKNKQNTNYRLSGKKIKGITPAT